jgi:hypothetical protein
VTKNRRHRTIGRIWQCCAKIVAGATLSIWVYVYLMFDNDDFVTDEDQYDDATEAGSNQPTNEDMLMDGDNDPDDWLDTGYSPPDFEPNTYGALASDDARGETLSDYLAAEEPEVWDADYVNVNERRAGRLVSISGGDMLAEDDPDGPNRVTDAVAYDVGIDGAGASAEEAAVHITEAP